ncbi:MAG: GNAT family N-acetyltransferase [Proteobacteria bacterium]|nr:GNAT family N-acetyltransferase [Pseudomonadota bacterium]MBU1743054.1 GNAT family N-acetyltransferase [Pseudomonadota bacterium]
MFRPIDGGFDEAREWADQWDELVNDSALPSPFLTYTWQAAWWRHFGAKRPLHLLALLDGDRLLGLAPLMKDRPLVKLAPVRRLSFVGTGLSDRLDFLYHKKGGPFLDALLEYLTREFRDWDVLELSEVPEESPTVGGLRYLARKYGLPLETRVQSVCPYLTLTRDNLARHEESATGRQIAGSTRKLARAGTVGHLWSHQARDPNYILETASAVDARSNKADKGWSLFLDPATRAFLAEVIEGFARRGLIEFHVLTLNGRPVTYDLSFAMGGRVMAYTASFDQELGALSPGVCVTDLAIRLFLTLGFKEYDLLRGDELYKYIWASAERKQLQIRLFNTTKVGRLYHRMRYGSASTREVEGGA